MSENDALCASATVPRMWNIVFAFVMSFMTAAKEWKHGVGKNLQPEVFAYIFDFSSFVHPVFSRRAVGRTHPKLKDMYCKTLDRRCDASEYRGKLPL
jgi:hypothetical protein